MENYIQRLINQDLAVLTAAIEIGHQHLHDEISREYAVRLRELLRSRTSPDDHYLFVRASMVFACGTPEGLADTIVEDGAVAYLISADKASCPNCRGQ